MDLSLDRYGRLEVEKCKDSRSLFRAARRWSRCHGPQVTVAVMVHSSGEGSVFLVKQQEWLANVHKVGFRFFTVEEYLAQN